ncbi:MAG: inositol monophosphatase family protein [Buchnera aphidicola (Eriosoma harunire)]
MHPMLNIAIRAVRIGGNFMIQKYDIQKHFDPSCNHNKNPFEQTIYISQQKIIKTILKYYPNHLVYTNDVIVNNSLNNTKWIINPLDGSLNFKKNIPHFCISIAIQIKNQTVISVIYDPIKNELFTAIKGKGAQLNGYRMRCNNTSNIIHSSISINFSHYKLSNLQLYLQIIKILLMEKINFRCTGSTTLDLAYVATGRLDCLLNIHFQPWVFCAGELQLKESGAFIYNLTHNNDNKTFQFSLIGNAKLTRLIFDKIKNHL